MTRRRRARRERLDEAARGMEVAMLDLAATSMDLHCAVHQLGRVLDDHTIRVDHEADT